MLSPAAGPAASCAGRPAAAPPATRHALHVAQDALGHLLEVGLALAQVLVLHVVELARQHFELRRQRPFGVVVALGDPVLVAADQLLVLQQHQVHVEQQHGAADGHPSGDRQTEYLDAHPRMLAASARAVFRDLTQGLTRIKAPRRLLRRSVTQLSRQLHGRVTAQVNTAQS
jgi:hypothetical protein